MREIKTEAQTLDLSKKVTVEVSLAELIVIAASTYEVAPTHVKTGLAHLWEDDFTDLREKPELHEVEIGKEIVKILASHGVKEDE